MKYLVDQNGKPFKEDLTTNFSHHASHKLKKIMDNNIEQEGKLALMMKLSALREPCGEKTSTLTFRRFLPYEIKDAP